MKNWTRFMPTGGNTERRQIGLKDLIGSVEAQKELARRNKKNKLSTSYILHSIQNEVK